MIGKAESWKKRPVANVSAAPASGQTAHPHSRQVWPCQDCQSGQALAFKNCRRGLLPGEQKRLPRAKKPDVSPSKMRFTCHRRPLLMRPGGTGIFRTLVHVPTKGSTTILTAGTGAPSPSCEGHALAMESIASSTTLYIVYSP